uniref:GNAT family N-acetyltransferase n=1 Tax=Flavobacterium sp. TaxID=239 RepID=UPI004049D985
MTKSLLQGKRTFLRALEPEDLGWLYKLENDESLWNLGDVQKPYSQYQLQRYIKESNRDIFDSKQLRLVLCRNEDKKPLGLFDLFDFDPKNKRVFVGLVIANMEDRGKGFGKEGLLLLMNFAHLNWQIHQVVATVGANNVVSKNLFESVGYKLIGCKKDWIYNQGIFSDEWMYQYIFKDLI